MWVNLPILVQGLSWSCSCSAFATWLFEYPSINRFNLSYPTEQAIEGHEHVVRGESHERPIALTRTIWEKKIDV